MNAPASTLPRRLELLERYLREDPSNGALLADACDEAIAGGAHDRALAHLQAAAALGLQTPAWRVRRAHLHMARHEWAPAREVLETLLAEQGAQPALAHDLAYVHFRAGDREACCRILQPWVTADGMDRIDDATRAALQSLWLRALHHLRRLDEAREWVAGQRARTALTPQAAGVASLVAVDADDFAQASTLSQQALDAGVAGTEALVARACIAIAQGENGLAQALLHRALELQPEDGRTLSTLGMASLQAQDLASARRQFARAVQALPDHIGTWHGLGWACLLLGDTAAALEAFQRALALDRNFGESHGAVGLALLASGRPAEAEHHLARAERLDARGLTAAYARSVQQGEAGDVQAVRALARRLLDRPGFFGRPLRETFDRDVK